MVDFENGSGYKWPIDFIFIWTVQQIQAQPSASPTAKKSDQDLIRISYPEYRWPNRIQVLSLKFRL